MSSIFDGVLMRTGITLMIGGLIAGMVTIPFFEPKSVINGIAPFVLIGGMIQIGCCIHGVWLAYRK